MNAAAFDLDRDGFSNPAEFRAGTLPGSPASHLRHSDPLAFGRPRVLYRALVK